MNERLEYEQYIFKKRLQKAIEQKLSLVDVIHQEMIKRQSRHEKKKKILY